VPVAGAVVRRWGDRTEVGPANGMSFRAPPLGRVVAPCAGRVAFAGPFRSFGVLIILDCGGGYHFVLAGLDRLDVQVGTSVQAGEPVGVMPGWDPASSGAHPGLYLELRREGQPIDPAPFLRGRF
jgi:septal ring factor EnvC (AmiA/AmiB activator)